MSEFVPADEIEQIVGVKRHATRHYACAVSAEQTVYILHSFACKDSGVDLRECLFSLALDNGIDGVDWSGLEDQPIRVTINRSRLLTPVRLGMRLNK